MLDFIYILVSIVALCLMTMTMVGVFMQHRGAWPMIALVAVALLIMGLN